MNVYDDEDLEICGAMCIDGDKVTLYVTPKTGKILYYDDLRGSNKVIENLILKDAMTAINDELVFNKLLLNKYGADAIGIIFCNHYALVMNSCITAEKRDLDNLSLSTNKMMLIDL